MAVPVRDDVPTRAFPWVTVLLIVVNTIIFLFLQPAAMQASPTDENGNIPFHRYEEVLDAHRYVYRWGAISCEITSGASLASEPSGCPPPCTAADYRNAPEGEEEVLESCTTWLAEEGTEGKNPWLALLTSLFLHGSIDHLAGNMLFLWVFGNNVEDRLGPWRYLALYLIGGVVASLGFVAVHADANVPLVGASGAISAAMGAYLIFHPRGRVLTIIATIAFQIVYVPAAVVLVLYFVTQFFTGEGNVAWEAHAAGMAFGVVAALALGRLPAVARRAAEDRDIAAVRGGTDF